MAAKKSIKEVTQELDVIQDRYKEEQKKRKKLLNELEDLKGKIRVYCRIRPYSRTENEDPEKKIPCFKINDEMSISIGTGNRLKDYNFDSIFGPESTQEDVFEDTKRLIQSAVDGYNVCIFAYGQTGSGKTFTIQGAPTNPGLTPRAIIELFDIIQGMENFVVKLSCTMTELYLKDLRYNSQNCLSPWFM